MNGPYPAGEYNGLTITRMGIEDALDTNELYLADGGYRDANGQAVTPSGLHTFQDRQQATARARHETGNKRFKDWGILDQVFHHDITLHGKAFHTIANIVQITIQCESPLFPIIYNEGDV